MELDEYMLRLTPLLVLNSLHTKRTIVKSDVRITNSAFFTQANLTEKFLFLNFTYLSIVILSTSTQGILLTDGRNISKWTGPYVGLSKTLK